ncbi:hypothetical protein IWQ47_001539 [Aquimarina sp. EL_43]|uniref:polymorphic toxin type 5 domain-containing protein n=1 Tax=unclassified Aquimarina TaxID=2627091 RepID=UPI0018CA4D64|nr:MULTISPECIES: polymorphic toxin type 5 domain-containing protein [unclassified Aquimarina]MBG6130378.1 hypothetical protein [Aquimarina sp. EL_35]MBG6149158.1 hypothetical protein [Aquimarina sp. EL_32]MBG6168468.1 hypothetical protein [Aquimarina sp. EL_43]
MIEIPENDRPITVSDGNQIDIYPSGSIVEFRAFDGVVIHRYESGDPLPPNIAQAVARFRDGRLSNSNSGVIWVEHDGTSNNVTSRNRFSENPNSARGLGASRTPNPNEFDIIPPTIRRRMRTRGDSIRETRLRTREEDPENYTQDLERGIVDNMVLGSRAIASDLVAQRQALADNLRVQDQLSPLENPFKLNDEAVDALLIGAVDIGLENIEGIFRIPQSLIEMRQMLFEFRAATTEAFPAIRRLYIEVSLNTALRNQLQGEILTFLAQPEVREQITEITHNIAFGTYEDELEASKNAYQLGQYRMSWYYQGRFITKVITTILSLISLITATISIVRNIGQVPNTLVSLLSKLKNIKARLGNLGRRIPNVNSVNSIPTNNPNPRYLNPNLRNPIHNNRPNGPAQTGGTNIANQGIIEEPRNSPTINPANRRRNIDSESGILSAEGARILDEDAIRRRRNTASQHIARLVRRQRLTDEEMALFMERFNVRVESADRRWQAGRFSFDDYDVNWGREESLRIILRRRGHPLEFLLDPERGNFLPSSGATENRITVHMGHVHTRHISGQKFIALEDGWANSVAGSRWERRRRYGNGVVRREVISIEGVPVERETAVMWERLGLLSPGTVLRSPLSRGIPIPILEDY